MNQQAAAMQAQAHLQAGGLFGAGGNPYLSGLYGPTNPYLMYGAPAANWAAAAYARSAYHSAGRQGSLTGHSGVLCLRTAASCGVPP